MEDELERRRRFSRKICFGSFVALCGFVSILLLGFFITQQRSCSGKHSLELAVCMACDDPRCLDCSGDSTSCNICEGGYYLDPVSKKCKDCDVDPNKVKCLACSPTADGVSTKCDVCQVGYRLDKGICVDCSDKSDNCMQCS